MQQDATARRRTERFVHGDESPGMSDRADWSAAVFAHNEAANIVACLEAVIAQRPQAPFPVHVLVNGSTDSTGRKVREYAARRPQVLPVAIALGDKANAWNAYAHEIAPDASIHFFVDGDTRPLPGAFLALARTMEARRETMAVGALPATGRDRVGWSRRMQAFGRLAGCLYALRGEWLRDCREQAVRMPVGFIGEDLLLSCLVKRRAGPGALAVPDPRLAFAPEARFAFRSMSPVRPGDWLKYAKRLVRYRVRDYQLALLLGHLAGGDLRGMPADVGELYRGLPAPPPYRWSGRSTPIDLLAVRNIRRARSARSRG